MHDDIDRWIAIDASMTADDALRCVADILAADSRDGRVRCPAFVLAPASRRDAIDFGLDPTRLAGYQTFLRLSPVPGIDEWSYSDQLTRLCRGLSGVLPRKERGWLDRLWPRAKAPAPPPPRVITLSSTDIRHLRVADKVRRIRPPRVELRADGNGATGHASLPFTIGVIGDFAGSRNLGPLASREFQSIDIDCFDRVRASITPPDVEATGSWRALRQLASDAPLGHDLRVLICPLSIDELRTDVMGAPDVRDSWLHRTMSSPAGHLPRFDIVLCDYPFGPDDAPLVDRLARIAAQSLTVMIAASPPAVPWQARGRQPPDGDGVQRFARVAHKAPPDDPECCPLYGFARDLCRLIDERGWCSALDLPDAGWRIDPPGIGALMCAERFARHLALQLAYDRHIADSAAQWLARYVMSADESGDVVRAARPLRSARFEPVDDATRPDVAGLLTLQLGYEVDAVQSPICLTVRRVT